MLVKLSLKQYVLPLLIWSSTVAIILGGTMVMASNAKGIGAEHELVWGFHHDSGWQDCEAQNQGLVLTMGATSPGS